MVRDYCAALALGNAMAAQPETNGAGNFERLHGTWVAVHAVRNGRDADYLRGQRLSFDSNRFASRGEQGDVLFQGTYRLDFETSPAQIDFRHERDSLQGTTWKGIFQVTGNTLRVCHNAPNPHAARPRDFEARPASECIVILFRRLGSNNEEISTRVLDRLEQ